MLKAGARHYPKVKFGSEGLQTKEERISSLKLVSVHSYGSWQSEECVPI